MVRANVLPIQSNDLLACDREVVNDRIDTLFVGRLREEKGVEELCHHWTQSGSGMVLGVCGDGPQFEDLRARYEGPDNILWARTQRRNPLLHATG